MHINQIIARDTKISLKNIEFKYTNCINQLSFKSRDVN